MELYRVMKTLKPEEIKRSWRNSSNARKSGVAIMHTIKEEPEEESSDEKGFIRGLSLRESLSSVQPRDRIRSLGNGWVEYAIPSGRLYYYNSETGEKSWKPPRKFEKRRNENENTSESFFLPQNSSLSREWDSGELVCSTCPNFEGEAKHTNVGKILRTGMLKTSVIETNDRKVKKKWVKSFVVLTEFFILLTAVVGSFRKLFKKTKTPQTKRYCLLNAVVIKDTISNHGNVYRLQTLSDIILFRSKSTTAAESWYQALTLVINNLKQNVLEHYDFKDRGRTNSFDFGVILRKKETPTLKTKSASLSDFSLDETDGLRSKCLSDYFGSKYPTPPGWITIFDSESEQFCYVNCITGKKWFRTMTDDGHPYFYEEGCDRRAWLLPSIYLDASSRNWKDIRKSNGSQKSLQSDI